MNELLQRVGVEEIKKDEDQPTQVKYCYLLSNKIKISSFKNLLAHIINFCHVQL